MNHTSNTAFVDSFDVFPCKSFIPFYHILFMQQMYYLTLFCFDAYHMYQRALRLYLKHDRTKSIKIMS